MIALIDGDIVAYRCSASCKEADPLEISCIRTDRLLSDILQEVEADKYKIFLSGGSNFRYDIYPEYKANRKDKPRPVHLQSTREFMINEWNAELCDGIEADDALGIHQDQIGPYEPPHEGEYKTVICSIDKDLLQIPGLHWNFVKKEWADISSIQGLRNFYKQLLLGDRTDNIPGFDGKMRTKLPKFLEFNYYQLDSLENEWDMYDYLVTIYAGDKETLFRNAQLLYIQREENDKWNPPEKLELEV